MFNYQRVVFANASKIDHCKWSLKSLQDFHFWEKVWLLTNKGRARNYKSGCKHWILALTCFDHHWGGPKSQFLNGEQLMINQYVKMIHV